jgi:hypothetical protein
MVVVLSFIDSNSGDYEQIFNFQVPLNNDLLSMESFIGCGFCSYTILDDQSYLTFMPDSSYHVILYNYADQNIKRFSRPDAPLVRFTDDEIEMIRMQRQRATSITGNTSSVNQIPTFRKRVLQTFRDLSNRVWVLLETGTSDDLRLMFLTRMVNFLGG